MLLSKSVFFSISSHLMLCLATFSKHTILIAEPIKKSTLQIHLSIFQPAQIQPDFQNTITYCSRYKTPYFFLQNTEAECLISFEVLIASLI